MDHLAKHTLKTQQGATLVAALLFLIVLTLIAVSNMGASRLQLRMAKNVQQKSVAFEASEDARETAEQRVRDIVANGGTFPSGQGLYNLTNVSAPAVTSKTFWQTASNYASAGASSGYVIEYLGQKTVLLDDRTTTQTAYAYRLTVLGRGQDGLTESVSQAIYLQN